MEKKIINGTKWSVIGEFSGKIITPIINMVLARLLIPSEFGVVINITIITSFADILTDGGFQKYIIQREFLSNKEKEQVINVAFWTNFLLSIFVYTWIFLFRSPLAQLLGNERLASIIPIASIQVILTSFTSIQIGILRRDFKFKSLFINRIITTAIPLFITIPLALLNFSYWSIIIGNIFSLVISSIILFIQSNWRPKIYYSIRQLKEMFGFSSWTQLESLFIWLTQWSDSFFVGKFMNSYFLGIYKTSMSTVSSILQLISSSTVPAMFSGLARVQNDEPKFNNIYYSTQKFSSLFLIPLGIGMYSYSDFLVKILLGNQWKGAGFVVANWAITSCLMVIFNTYSMEVYRAIGKPQISMLTQIINFIILVFTIFLFSSAGFEKLVIARSWSRLILIFVHSYFLYKIRKINVLQTFKNIYMYIFSSSIIILISYLQKRYSETFLFNFVGIIFCIIGYFTLLLLFKSERKLLFLLIKKRRIQS